MKTSHLLSLTLLSSTLLFTACGGGGGSDTPSKAATLTEIKTLDAAKSNFKALGALKNINLNNNGSQKLQQKASTYKTDTVHCEKSGTLTRVENDSSSTIQANQCKNSSEYIDGTFKITQREDGSEEISMLNLTVISSEVEIHTKNLLIVANSIDNWSTIDGDLNVVAKCFSGNFDFATPQKLVESSNGSENLESGILELNGAKYTFNNPYVTIEIAGKEEILLQSELEKRMQNNSTCTE